MTLLPIPVAVWGTGRGKPSSWVRATSSRSTTTETSTASPAPPGASTGFAAADHGRRRTPTGRLRPCRTLTHRLRRALPPVVPQSPLLDVRAPGDQHGIHGATYREHISGDYAVGEAEPRRGDQLGIRAGKDADVSALGQLVRACHLRKTFLPIRYALSPWEIRP